MRRRSDRATASKRWLGSIVLLACGSCNQEVSLGSWIAPIETEPGLPVAPAPAPSVVTTLDASVVAPPVLPPPTSSSIPDAGPPSPEPAPADMEAGAGPDRAEAGPPDTPDAASASPICADVGEPASLNRAGMNVGATATNTDWSWPQPLDSVEFDFAAEAEIGQDGYFWAYQFSFVAGIGGLLGMQGNGWFQAEPPSGQIETVKMIQFWIGGPPLMAELGDVAFPDARVASESSSGVPGLSIQTKFPWERCRVYRFRLGLDGSDAEGNRWYAAAVTDAETGVTTSLGRMLIPLDWGRLATSSTMWTHRFTLTPATSCNQIDYTSAVFGFPMGDDGDVEPLSYNNRFELPALCGSSRFTEFPDFIRHEVGVRP